MLSTTVSLAALFQSSVGAWNIANILHQFAAVAGALTCGNLSLRHEEVKDVLLRLIVVLLEGEDDCHSPVVLQVLLSLLSILLLASRSMTSSLKLSEVGLSVNLLDYLVQSGALGSNPFAVGLVFLLQIQIMHQQCREDSELLLSSVARKNKEHPTKSAFAAAARSISLSTRMLGKLQRASATPASSSDDAYFVNLSFYAFNRQPMRLVNAILGHSRSLSPSANPLTARSLSLASSGMTLITSILRVDSPHPSDTEDEEEEAVTPEEHGPPSTDDASFALFLFGSYVLLFPGQVSRVAEVLSSTLYLPQHSISPVLAFLAPHILMELSADLRITNRNRCILASVFVNSVLAQTVEACQYAMAARTLLKQMKISWTRAYVPVSTLPPNMYLFGARSEVFRLMSLDDDEYMREMSLLFQNDLMIGGLLGAEAPTQGKRLLKK